MQMKSILAGAAIALAASISTASADELQFSVLGGITATPMTQGEMAVVVGEGVVLTTGFNATNPQALNVVTAPGAAVGSLTNAITTVTNNGVVIENFEISFSC